MTRVNSPSRVASPPAAISPLASTGRDGTFLPVDEDREHIVDPEAGVIEGDDEIPRQPAPPLDPYTPEPGPRPGDRRAFSVMRWALLAIALAVGAIVLYAIVS